MGQFDLARVTTEGFLFATMMLVFVCLVVINIVTRGRAYGLRLILETALLLGIGIVLPRSNGSLHTLLLCALGLDVLAMFLYSGRNGETWHW